MRSSIRLLAVIAIAALAACGGGGSSAPMGGGSSLAAPTGPGGGGGGIGNSVGQSSGGAGPLVPPAGSIYLGAFVNPINTGTDASNIAQLESQIGRHFALSLHYYGWAGPFPGPNEAADSAAGRIPIISWNCGVTNAVVASGAQDANIISHAVALRAYGKPVFLRYMWEMNNPIDLGGRTQCVNPATDNATGSFSPTDFVAAWNHIRAIFVAQGATNVAFLWNPGGGEKVSPAAYYPGAASVDWVGFDDYDRSNESFQATYGIYASLLAYGKPIIIAETGANPAYQPTFFAAAVPTLQSSFSAVKGFVYFDAPGRFSWNLTPAGLTAFATMSQSPYLSAP
jgi:hypothetical protein